MKHEYNTSGTCAWRINLEMDGDIIKKVSFEGGCSGNQTGISLLVKGKKAQEVIDLLKGVKCGQKSTSCPDQLALALEEYLEEVY